MENIPVQNAIKLIGFQVQEVNLKIDPNCTSDGVVQEISGLFVEIGYACGYNDERDRNYSITFECKVRDKNNFLDLSMKCTGVFETEIPISEDFKNSSFVKTNSPAIVFPFIRSFITTVTANAGIPPVILPAFNFTKKVPVPQHGQKAPQQ